MKRRLGLLVTMLVMAAPAALAYPEFEVSSEKSSGKFIDCAMCHSHAEGPEGVKAGQIRSLSREDLDRLGEARAAFEPGIAIDSPILNPFGDRIIEKLGRKKFLEIRASGPGQLAALYGMDSDLDGDGIPDAREFMEGTSPVDSRSGDPWSLFATNLRRSWLDILLTILATLAGLYGLDKLLRWFEHQAQTPQEIPAKQTDTTLGYLGRNAAQKRRGR